MNLLKMMITIINICKKIEYKIAKYFNKTYTMGIYYVDSNSCDCKGLWCTLTDDYRIRLDKPCDKHKIINGNFIFYDLRPIFKYCLNLKEKQNFDSILRIKNKYLLEIIDVKIIYDKNKIPSKLIKVQFTDEHIANMIFNETKNVYHSDMNNCPMWQKNNNTLIMCFVYDPNQHTIENEWISEDHEYLKQLYSSKN